MVGLKAMEAFAVSEEVVIEIVASDAMNYGKIGINLNLVFEDVFDCTTFNHIY